MKKELSRKREVFLWGIVFLGIFLWGISIKEKVNYAGDAQDYLLLSESLKVGKDWYFPQNVRGYVYPTILYFLRLIGRITHIGEYTGILIGKVLLFLFSFGIVFPDLLGMKGKRWKSCIVIVMFLFWWNDLLFWTLTDLCALECLMLAVWLLTKKHRKVFFEIIRLISVGGLVYMAYNVRTIYLLAIPVIIIGFLIKEKFTCKSIVSLGLIGVGFCILSIPQMIINYKYFGNFSMLINTSFMYGEKSLFLQQLVWGIQYQHYDTWLGNSTIYPSAALYYHDSVGEAILNKVGEISSYSDYVKVWIRYPLDMLGIWGRHIANSFLLPFGQVYVTRFRGRAIYIVLNFLVIFLFGMVMFYYARRKCLVNKVTKLVNWIPALITCFCISFGAVESRYMVVIYIIIYYYLANAEYRELWNYYKNKKCKVIITFCLCLILACALWGTTMSSTDVPILLQ